MIVDGKNAVLGRLAAMIAKKLLAGEDVTIVNAERIIVTGDPNQIAKKYIERRKRGSPQHGPFFPKQPERIVHRTIRGMMPYKTNKGRSAMKKLHVYVGVPESLESENFSSLATKAVKSDYISVGEIAKTLGWHKK